MLLIDPVGTVRLRSGAIVLTKHTVALGTATKRLSPMGFITNYSRDA